VSSADVTPTHASHYWPWVLLRALPAAVVAVVITFSADHSTTLGFVTFGALALVTGAILLVGAIRSLDSGTVRTVFVLQAVVSVLVGAIALVFPGAGLGLLLLLVGGFGVVTGFLELYSGLRSRRSGSGTADSAKDWIFLGGLTVLLAVAALVIPPGYNQPFTGPDGVERALTASIIIVGIIGAYAAIAGVYLVIAGLSLKWADRAVAAPAAESGI
jgi:uncharacterized membrane protein HdeD (DUF308 family)